MERVAFTVSDASNLAREKHLRPFSAEAKAVMDKLTISEDVNVEIYRPRNSKFANKVQLVFERIAQAKGTRVRNVRGWIAALSGRADIIELTPGALVMVAWGTGPRDMNAEDFESFWEDARVIIIDKILPTLRDDDAQDIKRML